MKFIVDLFTAEPVLVDEAFAELEALHVHHYEAAGEAFTRAALDNLFRLVLTAIEDRDAAAVVAFAEGIAEDRYNSGFDVSEVQTAFNTLETTMWRRIRAVEPPDDLVEAVALLSTVFGIAKDALARKYVSLATHRHVPSLDLTALFRGTIS